MRTTTKKRYDFGLGIVIEIATHIDVKSEEKDGALLLDATIDEEIKISTGVLKDVGRKGQLDE